MPAVNSKILDIVRNASSTTQAVDWVKDYMESKDCRVSREYCRWLVAQAYNIIDQERAS